jgi:hypothetical protein
VHPAAAYPLTPPHDAVACNGCHEQRRTRNAATSPRRAGDCAACHDDPHAGQFNARGATCSDCHHPTHFTPARFGIAQHATAAFPLTGAHTAVACHRCHAPVPGERPLRFSSAPTACADCHGDAHRGQLGRDCAACHTTTSFHDRALPFDHGATGFALRGAHAHADCAACHPRTAPDRDGHVFAPAAGRACADCHEDPHLGQFRRDGARAADCAACHDEDSAFATVRFDHDRDSRFPLEGAHRGLACNSCHRRYPVAGTDRVVVRYKPLGVSCADCHGAVRRTGR